jgi:phage-related baseplate assembly protein
MAELPIPEFFNTNAFEIRGEMISIYEGLTGRTLMPAEVEILLFGAYAYREVMHKSDCNSAALQNLVAFATFPVLDYLGENVGVERNPPQKARTTMEFNLLAAHPNLVIQSGTRVSHPDGQPVFEVIEDTLVVSGVDVISLTCEAVEEGTLANGFSPGTIKTLIDRFPYFDTCENTDITAGGSEEETNEQLRERIYLAPAAFSSAGPLDAYRFHALSAHPSVIDVAVEGPELGKFFPPPGTVVIYPLTATVPTPPVVLEAVRNACNGEKRRPDTDTVIVEAPTKIDYAIELGLILYKGADDQFITDQLVQSLNTYKDNKGSKLGLDIVREQIIGLCTIEGVYKPVLNQPPADIPLGPSQFGNVTGIQITILGYTNG